MMEDGGSGDKRLHQGGSASEVIDSLQIWHDLLHTIRANPAGGPEHAAESARLCFGHVGGCVVGLRIFSSPPAA
jgi:hypothetical protein